MKRQEYLEQCAALDETALHERAAEMRKKAESRVPPEMKEMLRSLDNVTQVEEIYQETAFGKTHLYLVRESRPESVRPVLVNVHGGGWTMPHTDRDIYLCRRMAVRTGCLVVDVDYVLAPEHPYPAALKELEALFDALISLVPAWGGNPEKILLCGQSAGGNLIAGVLHRGHTTLRPLSQILCYLPADNYNDHFDGEDLDPRGMDTELYGFFYNRTFEDRANPDVSLALVDPAALPPLPPTDMMLAGRDNLLPEALRYRKVLQAAGVPTTVHVFEDSRHGFLVNLYDEWEAGEDYLADLILRRLQGKSA